MRPLRLTGPYSTPLDPSTVTIPDLRAFSRLTLGETLSVTRAHFPNNVAMRFEDRSWTWAELDDEVNRVARLMQSLGVAPGDPVGLWMNKRAEVVTAFLAAARLRAVAVPFNFKLNLDKLLYQFHQLGVAVLFTQAEHIRDVEACVELLPDSHRVVVIEDEVAGNRFTPYSAHLQHSVETVDMGARPEDVVYLNYTSGTTGYPKGAVTTHEMIQWNAISSIETLGTRHEDVFLCMFSVFAHPHELFHRPMLLGGTLCLVDSLNSHHIAKAIDQYQVTWVMAVPSFYEMLLDHMESGAARLSSLRVLEAGGAHVPKETLYRLEERFGAKVLPVWGSTETTGVGVASSEAVGRKPGTMGRPARYYEIKVVDEEGRTVPPGETGEMVVRGPGVVTGYYRDEEETKTHFKEGWYHTNDLVAIDEDGFFTFQGRRNEMMKIGGIRVFPLEIELVVRQHPKVADVVVVRAEEKLRGEIARAVVILKAGETCSASEIKAWCRTHLALYKVPRVVEFWAAVPRTPAGKVDKKAIVATPIHPAS